MSNNITITYQKQKVTENEIKAIQASLLLVNDRLSDLEESPITISSWDTTDKAVIESQIVEMNVKLDDLETTDQSIVSQIANKQNKIFVTVGKNDSTADYNTADYTNDMLAISNAITYAVANNFTKVLIKKGNYIYNSNSTAIQLVSNFLISGEKGTKITGSKNAGWIFRNNSTDGNSIIENCIIKDINFDLQNVANGSAIAFLDCRNSGTINCNYVNGGAGGWFIKFGTEPSTTSTFLGDNNFVLDSNWNNHAGSLEMLLLFNQKNFYGENWVFENKTGSNPVFGLWQNTENTRIKNLSVRNCNGFSYYSNSTNNTFIDNFYVENSGCALQGANVSDNLIFGPVGGIQRAVGLYVNNFVAKGGFNSSTSSAIELGAIQDYNIDTKLIEGYQRGFTFSKGNNLNNANAKFGTIKIGTIKNLNPDNLNYDLSAPFVFVKGGSYHLRVEGGNIYDERATPLMIQPIFYEWDGDSTPFSNITFEGGDFRSYLDRPTFRKNSNVTLESSVRMESMKNPVQGSFSSYYYDYAYVLNPEVENSYEDININVLKGGFEPVSEVETSENAKNYSLNGTNDKISKIEIWLKQNTTTTGNITLDVATKINSTLSTPVISSIASNGDWNIQTITNASINKEIKIMVQPFTSEPLARLQGFIRIFRTIT